MYFSNDKDIQSLCEEVISAGWATGEEGTNHTRLVPVDKSKDKLTVPGTPSGGRAFENFRSQVKRTFGDLPNLDPSLRNKAEKKDKSRPVKVEVEQVRSDTTRRTRHWQVVSVRGSRVDYFIRDNESEGDKQRWVDAPPSVLNNVYPGDYLVDCEKDADGWWHPLKFTPMKAEVGKTALAAALSSILPEVKTVKVEPVKEASVPAPVIQLKTFDDEEAALLRRLEDVRARRKAAEDLELNRQVWVQELDAAEVTRVRLMTELHDCEQVIRDLSAKLGKTPTVKSTKDQVCEKAYKDPALDAFGRIIVTKTAAKHNLNYRMFQRWMNENHRSEVRHYRTSLTC